MLRARARRLSRAVHVACIWWVCLCLHAVGLSFLVLSCLSFSCPVLPPLSMHRDLAPFPPLCLSVFLVLCSASSPCPVSRFLVCRCFLSCRFFVLSRLLVVISRSPLFLVRCSMFVLLLPLSRSLSFCLVCFMAVYLSWNGLLFFLSLLVFSSFFFVLSLSWSLSPSSFCLCFSLASLSTSDYVRDSNTSVVGFGKLLAFCLVCCLHPRPTNQRVPAYCVRVILVGAPPFRYPLL